MFCYCVVFGGVVEDVCDVWWCVRCGVVVVIWKWCVVAWDGVRVFNFYWCWWWFYWWCGVSVREWMCCECCCLWMGSDYWCVVLSCWRRICFVSSVIGVRGRGSRFRMVVCVCESWRMVLLIWCDECGWMFIVWVFFWILCSDSYCWWFCVGASSNRIARLSRRWMWLCLVWVWIFCDCVFIWWGVFLMLSLDCCMVLWCWCWVNV